MTENDDRYVGHQYTSEARPRTSIDITIQKLEDGRHIQQPN
jgi:hypothetical protein